MTGIKSKAQSMYYSNTLKKRKDQIWYFYIIQ
ncbi:MAG: hypothetical protein ACI9JN_000129 [Bacteroidia bacterium]|jgi:hypothetical protein